MNRQLLQQQEKYNVYCLSIAMNILGNIEDAEECVNDAYLNTWNSIPPNKPKNVIDLSWKDSQKYVIQFV